jgi:riboflavin synthase
MFTGIVEEVGRVVTAGSGMLSIAAEEVLQGLELGGSIAVNGACLTVTHFDSKSFSVDVTEETLKRTNLGLLTSGAWVNLEHPLDLGKPLGGHLVQGHVDGTGRVAGILRKTGGAMFRFEAPPEIMRYVVEKGFIAVDGISLTIVDLDISSFQVAVVEFTERHTVLGYRRVGDLVNLEIDIIAKYVERLHQPRSNGVTADFLQEHGFSVG